MPTQVKARNAFVEKLCALMDGAGTTQQTLADKIGTTRQTISQYMNGDIEPKMRAFAAIAEYFGVSCDYLLGLSTNECRTEDEKDNLIGNLREANAKLNDLVNRIHAMTRNKE